MYSDTISIVMHKACIYMYNVMYIISLILRLLGEGKERLSCYFAEQRPRLKVIYYTDSIPPESGKIKRMRTQLIPGSPFPTTKSLGTRLVYYVVLGLNLDPEL